MDRNLAGWVGTGQISIHLWLHPLERSWFRRSGSLESHYHINKAEVWLAAWGNIKAELKGGCSCTQLSISGASLLTCFLGFDHLHWPVQDVRPAHEWELVFPVHRIGLAAVNWAVHAQLSLQSRDCCGQVGMFYYRGDIACLFCNKCISKCIIADLWFHFKDLVQGF